VERAQLRCVPGIGDALAHETARGWRVRGLRRFRFLPLASLVHVISSCHGCHGCHAFRRGTCGTARVRASFFGGGRWNIHFFSAIKTHTIMGVSPYPIKNDVRPSTSLRAAPDRGLRVFTPLLQPPLDAVGRSRRSTLCRTMRLSAPLLLPSPFTDSLYWFSPARARLRQQPSPSALRSLDASAHWRCGSQRSLRAVPRGS
jgi:hypothetical protein